MRNQERILSMIHKALGNIPSNEWGDYEEAKKIFNKSKSWYQAQRNTVNGSMLLGKHYRMVGREVEYHLPSLLKLKATNFNQVKG